MKPLHTILIGGVLLLASLGSAIAQTGDAGATGTSNTDVKATTNTDVKSTSDTDVKATGNTDVKATGNTDVKSTMSAETSANASTDADAKIQAVRERATKASSRGRAVVDKQLKKISADVDAEANAKGKAVAAGRVAAEFGLTGDQLAAEADQFSAGLGEVIIAHTLMANSKTTVTMEDVFKLRGEGMGWGQIAQGLDLRLGEVVSAARAEAKVAQGTAKSTGKVATIRSGVATHASTHAGVGAGVKAGHTGAAGVGVGAGVDTKVGK